MNQIGPNRAQEANFENRDPRLWLIVRFESIHHYQRIDKIIWAYTSDKMGQMDQNWDKCWAKISQIWLKIAKLDRITFF